MVFLRKMKEFENIVDILFVETYNTHIMYKHFEGCFCK